MDAPSSAPGIVHEPDGPADDHAASDVDPVRVLTVDDHPGFCATARALVEATDGFEYVGSVSSAAEADAALERLRPNLVLMDVVLPEVDGCEASRRIRTHDPTILVVLISAAEEPLHGRDPTWCDAVAMVAKADLRPHVLADLWRAHRAVA